MQVLGHETTLRSELGFPAMKNLWGKNSGCVWNRDAAQAVPTSRLIRRDPERVCRALDLSAVDRLILVDELIVHTQFAAAHDFASYLASTPELLRQHVRRQMAASQIDLRIMLFLRLKAILAAVEGGMNHRAHAELLQAQRLLPPHDSDLATTLLRANISLLWGRLLQLLRVPGLSLEHLQRAEALFERSSLGPTPGLRLVMLRSLMSRERQYAKHGAATVDQTVDETSGLNLHGGLTSHYKYYLLARLALDESDWTAALEFFEQGRKALRLGAHNGTDDPIRLGYSILGRGRALVGRGLKYANRRTDVEDGLKLLLQARWLLQENESTAGEYVAYRHYLHAKFQHERTDLASTVHLLKELQRLGDRTEIPFFQLESVLAYAQALYKSARPNAARAAIRRVTQIAADSMSDEISQQPIWKEAVALEDATASARDNAVEPTQMWGMSEYAEHEREFVERALKSGCLVSVYGPPGSGRRVLIERINEARRFDATLAIVDGTKPHTGDVLSKVRTLLQANQTIVLYNLDRWPTDLQYDVVAVVSSELRWSALTYVTLRTQLIDSDIGEELAPTVGATLAAGAWDVEPLASRADDTPLLARGFLVRSLIARLGEAERERAKNVILTSQACNYITQTYSAIGVGGLYRAMRFLAHRMRWDRDLIPAPGSLVKLPAETIQRYLLGRPKSPDDRKDPSQIAARPPGPALGPDIKSADAETVRLLAEQFGGRLARVAKTANVPRATLIASWSRSDVLKHWYDAGGMRGRAGR